MTEFEKETQDRIVEQGANESFLEASRVFMNESIGAKYSYNFLWLGRPIIQHPQDIVGLQEMIWKIQPDVIVETGIAHGGSLILSASLLALNEVCGGTAGGKVIGVDIDIREHNRKAIEEHPMFDRISLIEGSSIDPEIVAEVEEAVGDAKTVLVVLDSNHTHEHVLEELRLYHHLVSKGSYLIVFDTIVEHLPPELIGDRPWGKGNSPGSAVVEFLTETDRFELDEEFETKLMVTAGPGGFLKCLKD
ncbi:MAG: CmcI family methyltransferase [Verrucomicrobiota bacterium]